MKKLLAMSTLAVLLTTTTSEAGWPYRGYYQGGFRIGGTTFAPAGPSFGYRGSPVYNYGYAYRPYAPPPPVYFDSWGSLRPIPYASGVWPYFNPNPPVPVYGGYGYGGAPPILPLIQQFLFMFGRRW